MSLQNYACDAVHWHIGELASRVIAQSGIPTDRFHLGKIILRSLKDAPEFILQIDGATSETETFESGLKRSVQCANAFRKMGLKTNDIIVIMAPNHIHLTIPMYAALYLGVAVVGVDTTSKVEELEKTLNTVFPKVIFCQDNKCNEVQEALKSINQEAKIITYDESHSYLTLSKLLENGDDVSIEDFKASDFDPETTIAILLATSGTTGLPKFAALSHKNWLSSAPYICTYFKQPYIKFPTPFKMSIVISPVHWLTSTLLFTMSPVLRFSRIQSSLPMTPEHFQDLVNKYRPSLVLGNPNTFLQIMDREKCDLTCFERIIIGGSAVPTSLIKYLQEASPNTQVRATYGASEVAGIALNNANPLPGSLGTPLSSFQYKFIDPETQEEINEANLPGELWLKGPGVFMLYYNNAKMTAETKTKDGWLKTGDIFYKDECENYFYVERLKMMMSYMNHQISPLEIETVIMEHPGVLNVAVTRIPDKERGDLPVACVVRREGYDVTAQEIKEMVKNTLADSRQLRGGVIFMKEFPMTSSAKVHRTKLASMVLTMERE